MVDYMYMVGRSAAGFIEFIVDPSFHVMHDAIATLTASLQQQCRHDDDNVTTADDVIVSAEPSPPPTPFSTGSSVTFGLIPPIGAYYLLLRLRPHTDDAGVLTLSYVLDITRDRTIASLRLRNNDI